MHALLLEYSQCGYSRMRLRSTHGAAAHKRHAHVNPRDRSTRTLAILYSNCSQGVVSNNQNCPTSLTNNANIHINITSQVLSCRRSGSKKSFIRGTPSYNSKYGSIDVTVIIYKEIILLQEDIQSLELFVGVIQYSNRSLAVIYATPINHRSI